MSQVLPTIRRRVHITVQADVPEDHDLQTLVANALESHAAQLRAWPAGASGRQIVGGHVPVEIRWLHKYVRPATGFRALLARLGLGTQIVESDEFERTEWKPRVRP